MSTLRAWGSASQVELRRPQPSSQPRASSSIHFLLAFGDGAGTGSEPQEWLWNHLDSGVSFHRMPPIPTKCGQSSKGQEGGNLRHPRSFRHSSYITTSGPQQRDSLLQWAGSAQSRELRQGLRAIAAACSTNRSEHLQKKGGSQIFLMRP